MYNFQREEACDLNNAIATTSRLIFFERMSNINITEESASLYIAANFGLEYNDAKGKLYLVASDYEQRDGSLDCFRDSSAFLSF